MEAAIGDVPSYRARATPASARQTYLDDHDTDELEMLHGIAFYSPSLEEPRHEDSISWYRGHLQKTPRFAAAQPRSPTHGP